MCVNMYVCVRVYVCVRIICNCVRGLIVRSCVCMHRQPGVAVETLALIVFHILRRAKQLI